VSLAVAGTCTDDLLCAAVDADADVALVGVLLAVDLDAGSGEVSVAVDPLAVA
jgi:hypothetical protein